MKITKDQRQRILDRAGWPNPLCEQMVPFMWPIPWEEGRPISLYRRCNKVAVDIHHIVARGLGGSRRVYRDNELIVLCRGHHDELLGKHGLLVRSLSAEGGAYGSYEEQEDLGV